MTGSNTIDGCMTIEEIAKVAYEINDAYCKAIGDALPLHWDQAKESVIHGVEMHLRHPDSTQEDSHESWLEFKQKEGWVYGKEKSESLRTHPCMVPYSELPEKQRVKDFLFKQVVESLRPLGT